MPSSSLIVGNIVVALVLLTEMRHQPPVWLHLLLLPLTMILVLALMRPFKATLIALQTGIVATTSAPDATTTPSKRGSDPFSFFGGSFLT